jgi:hypothetical protein
MVAIQIRDVPDDVRDALQREAERRHQSLQTMLMDILTREAASARNRSLLASWEAEPPIIAAGRMEVPAIIRDGRLEREGQIRGALGLHPDAGAVE